MTDKVKFKAFPTAFKLAAIKRLEAGEAVLRFAQASARLAQGLEAAWASGIESQARPQAWPAQVAPAGRTSGKGQQRRTGPGAREDCRT
jgi:hypothetical protein